MITIEKIEIYKKYDATDFEFIIFTKREKRILEDGDLGLIGSLIADLTLVKDGLAAKSYAEGVFNRLKQVCDTAETQEAIKQMAGF